MRINKILLVPVVLLFLYTSAWAFTETRNIYIGDIITLKVSFSGNKALSAEELKEKFKAFEIVETKDTNGEHIISLRTFEVGEHKILLGDKEIVINIQSTLNDIEREGIFEGDLGAMEQGFLFHWRIIFYIAAGLFLMSGGYVLINTLLIEKIKAQTPLQIFLRRSGALSAVNDGYFVDLTFYFKEYLECLHKFRIIGKTTVEIVNELKEIDLLSTILPEIKEWLTECDRLKFTGVKASAETKQEHYRALLKIVEKIDAQNEVTK